MSIGSKKVERPLKTKFRKNKDNDNNKSPKNRVKHHDRSFYRLVKEEKQYVL
jgi:hypothetical protein